MSDKIRYSEAVEEKRSSQRAYVRNISVLLANRVRGCSYGQVRRAKNTLVRIAFK